MEENKKVETKQEEVVKPKKLTEMTKAELEKLPKVSVKVELGRTQKGYEIPNLEIALDKPKNNKRPYIILNPYKNDRNVDLDQKVRAILLKRGVRLQDQEFNVPNYQMCPARFFVGTSVNSKGESRDHFRVEALVADGMYVSDFLTHEQMDFVTDLNLKLPTQREFSELKREFDEDYSDSW